MSNIEENMPTRRRRVLMISYAFPPAGGSGVQRAAKFAKHLPRFGWEPIVWCADEAHDLPRDETLLHDLPAGLRRYAHRAWRPGMGTLAIARQALREISGRQRFGMALDWRLRGLMNAVSRCYVPDDAICWALSGLPAAYRLVKREAIDAIWSTYSPASNHVLGWLLKRLTGRPWIADFRDLWTDNYDYAEPSAVRRRLHRWLEDKFVSNADAVIGVTPEQTRILASHLRGQESKFATLYNGVDLDDFAGLDRARIRSELGLPVDRFVLSYVGRLCGTAQPAAMISGVAKFLRDRLATAGRFELRIVGTVPATTSGIIAASGLQPTMTGYVSHRDAIRELIAADGLLLGNTTTGANSGSVIPGKLFEYLAAGRPILHIGPARGATDRIISECQCGVTVPPNAAAVAAAVDDLWLKWLGGAPGIGCATHRLAPFTRVALAEKLASLLNHACGAATAHGDLQLLADGALTLS